MLHRWELSLKKHLPEFQQQDTYEESDFFLEALEEIYEADRDRVAHALNGRYIVVGFRGPLQNDWTILFPARMHGYTYIFGLFRSY